MSQPQHGTWQRYVNKRIRCRCDDCRAAWRTYQADRNRAIAYGRHTPDPLIDATPAREHLERLAEQGAGIKALAVVSGVHRTTLELVRSGERAKLRRRTFDAILAITVDPDQMPDRSDVDGTGTRRRLRALVAVGWSMSLLADRLGCRAENVRQIVNAHDGRRVTAATYRAARDVYDELWNVRPPSFTAGQRSSVQASLNRARERGWLPPMAWDDDSIDDPNATPDLGGKALRTPDETAEEVAWYLRHVDSYATTPKVAERFGYSGPDGIWQALRRAGRDDLIDRLTLNYENAPRPEPAHKRSA